MIRKIAKVVLSSRRWTHALTYTWKREHTYSTKFLSKLQTIVNYLEINEKDITVECYVSTRILIFKINVLKAEMVGLVIMENIYLITQLFINTVRPVLRPCLNPSRATWPQKFSFWCLLRNEMMIIHTSLWYAFNEKAAKPC